MSCFSLFFVIALSEGGHVAALRDVEKRVARFDRTFE